MDEKCFITIGSWAQCYETFSVRNLQFFNKNLCLSLARTLPKSGASERCLTWLSSSLIQIHKH
jgi:hypothetical protein